MEAHVDEDAIRKLGKEIAKGIKTEADLGDFSTHTGHDGSANSGTC